MKNSTKITLSIFYKIAIFAFRVLATMCWLNLILESDLTVAKILCTCATVLCAAYAIADFSRIVQYIWRRHKRRKDGILEDAIAADHGSTIAEVINGIKDEPVEFVAFFSPKGEKICEGTLRNPYETSVENKYIKTIESERGCISIHNHPGDDNQAFSKNDILNAILLGVSRAIVVTQAFCFVMDFPEDHQVKAYDVNKFISQLPLGGIVIGSFHAEGFVGSNETDQIIADAGNKIANPDCVRSLALCAAVAERFGFFFWATPTNAEHNSLLKETS